MKLFLKIVAVLLALFILLLVGLNIYFTDEHLKNTILPHVQSAVGSEVEVDRMSITFFRTFPRFGLDIDGLRIPDPHGDLVASLDELLVSLELFPLFRDEISVSRLSITRPVINYTVFADSTTNIDFLLDDEDVQDEECGYSISIPGFTLRDASVFYTDETTNSAISLEQLNADISLFFGYILESRVDADLGSLNVMMDGTSYISNLSMAINQTSTLDLENEVVTFTEGTVSIRGLALNLTGSISDWGSDELALDLQFASSSENFGELLRLAPPDFEEYITGLQTRGSLLLEGSVEGIFAEETLPNFDFTLEVTDGFLQNPDLPEAIEDINFRILFNNDLATISNFRARAGVNSITASGTVERPLEDDATFSLDLDGDINLETISSFYPIEDLGVDQLAGLLKATARATGRVDSPEDAVFSGVFNLTNGLLKYADVPRPIEQINARIDANQDRILIEESGFTAANNRFRLSGTVLRPLDEAQRTVDVNADINFDLATIKDFYPIDEDTLSMRGQLVANVVLRGRPDPEQIETLLQQSTFELTNGYLAHSIVSNPLEDITFRAEATGRRLSISEARFKTGENNLSMRGSVVNYLSDNPEVDLTFDGNAALSSITSYYSLEPWIQELTGGAVMNLRTQGPVNDITRIALNGSLEVSDVSAAGDSLFLPVTELNGRMSITPQTMNLERFSMNYGSTDINLQGSLRNYLGFLDDHTSTETMPAISGTYRSRFLNMDEMIDWDDETDDPIPIELPNLTANVNATIDRLVIFGIPITEITGTSRITPTLIRVDEAQATLFEGTATGRMDWNVPDPLQTNLLFNGKLEGVRAEAFFRDTGFLGPQSTLHNYITGEFNTEIRYFTQLTPEIDPDITTTDANGTFGMSRARMRGHPIQRRIAEFLNASELETLTLDSWNADFSIKDTVMTIQNFSITSGNLGMQLDGTLHMVNDRINYRATLLLPERFKRGIATVISSRAADALQLEDGRLAVPIRITGTTANPQVRPDNETIERIVRDYIQDGARDLLRRLF
ncbi:MAG: AsmA family protein [Balneolaceae bacterium]|nr:MAG: AsmA family protein [Balneolaceae bacterium]